jgi:hypothetical protein
MRSILHIVCAVLATLAILGVLLASLALVSWLVFGLLAVLLRVHVALGYAYAGLLWACAVPFIVRDIRKGKEARNG